MCLRSNHTRIFRSPAGAWESPAAFRTRQGFRQLSEETMFAFVRKLRKHMYDIASFRFWHAHVQLSTDVDRFEESMICTASQLMDTWHGLFASIAILNGTNLGVAYLPIGHEMRGNVLVEEIPHSVFSHVWGLVLSVV